MRNVGFFGGPSLFELGPVADVELFFDCLTSFAIPADPAQDWTVLTDRFYRRYLRREELATAQAAMDRVKTVFERTSAAFVDWPGVTAPSAYTKLDPGLPNLALIFAKYFEAFSHCREAAEIFWTSWRQYQPVRIVVSDLPVFMNHKRRPLEEYDALVGEPFWKR